MLPGNGIGDTDKSCYPGSPEYKFKYGSEGLKTSDIKEYIRNPHKFNIKEEMDGKYYNLWSTDNDKTDANDDVVIKSVYDPSPVGYSLPASNAFTGFTTTGKNAGDWNAPVTPEERAKFNVKGNWDNGWYFYTKPNKIGNTTFFFPASGNRYRENGIFGLIFKGGYAWLSGVSDKNNVILLGFSIVNIHTIGGLYKAYGLPVRSAEEKKVDVGCRDLQCADFRCIQSSANCGIIFSLPLLLLQLAIHRSHSFSLFSTERRKTLCRRIHISFS